MRIITRLSVLALMALASACGKIPSAYQGSFRDAASGTQLTLQSGSGTLTFADGRILTAKAADLQVNALLKAQAGIFVTVPDASEKNHLDIFWVSPDANSKREEGGLVWFRAEVLYAAADSKQKTPVEGIPMFHCLEGTVLIDSVTGNWEIGCPAKATRYEMQRVQKTLRP
ncbi:MAG: hypothetical protein AB7P04_14050 [Bacteriovoracia bacterium]